MQKTNKKMAGANIFIGTCLICKQAKLSNQKTVPGRMDFKNPTISCIKIHMLNLKKQLEVEWWKNTYCSNSNHRQLELLYYNYTKHTLR